MASTYNKTRLEKLCDQVCITRARIRHAQRQKAGDAQMYNIPKLKTTLDKQIGRLNEEIQVYYSPIQVREL
jgi:hypothetical protein